jgi:beta-N-acetylhexosaminidase
MKINGSIFIDVMGKKLHKDDIRRISHPLVQGIILFTRNYENKTQLRKLIDDIKLVRSDLIISVDHEGGRVQRFKKGFYNIPPMNSLDKIYIEDERLATKLAEYIGWIIAKELGDMNIDLNFSPVLDINYGKSSVIGDRSFSANFETVVNLAAAFKNGLNAGGMAAIGKHFPGHGFIKEDSHIEISIDERGLEELGNDLQCFKKLINLGIEGIMPGHVIYPQVDNKPASLSEKWITNYLKNIYGFKGPVISDDLSMLGVATYLPDIYERVISSFKAGCDISLICNDEAKVDELLLKIKPNQVHSRPLDDLRLDKEKNKNIFFKNNTYEDIKNFIKSNLL